MLSPSKPLPADERTLIEMWHGPNSTAAIAADLGIKGSDLDLAFRRLKNEGKLPKQSRQRVHQAESGDRPAADEDGSAALLEALIRVHGNDDPSGERADLYPGCKRR
jgi:Mn-dependent DtxR family transcriptional regulator